MSDTNFVVTPEQYAGLTDGGKAQLESALTKAGATPEYIAGLKSGTTAKPEAKGSADDLLRTDFTNGTKSQYLDPSLRPPPTAAAHLGSDKIIGAFQKLREAGVSDAQLQKAAAEEGVAWADIVKEATTAPPQNMTTAQANEKLAATSGPFAAGSDPNDYSFQFDPRYIEGLDENAVAEIHSMFREGFHQGGVPLSLSGAVARDAVEAANQFDNLDEAQTKVKFAEEGAKLRRLGNVEKLTEDHNYAWNKFPDWFKEAAAESRMFHTADSFLALSRAGEMMKLRDTRKGK